MLNKSDNIIEKEFKNLRKELLDLTLRNQLLNFKSRAKTITIVNQSPTNLFQTLVLQENKMYFVANKKDKKEDKSSVWDHIPFDFSKFSEGDKKLEQCFRNRVTTFFIWQLDFWSGKIKPNQNRKIRLL